MFSAVSFSEGANVGALLSSNASNLSSCRMISWSCIGFPMNRKWNRVSVSASTSVEGSEGNKMVLSGVVFEPFEEVKNEAFLTPIAPQASLARQNFSDDCEAAINEQIK